MVGVVSANTASSLTFANGVDNDGASLTSGIARRELFVESHAGPQTWLQAGSVRTNAFRKNLVAGFQPFASEFPVDLSPAQIGGFVDPNAPAASRRTGSNAIVLADQIQILLGDPLLVQLYYLRGDGTSWRTPGRTTNFANQPILGATSAVLLRRVKPDDGYRIRPPFEP